MSEIIAKSDDTFERVSRQAYGSQSGALQISQANPGVVEPIPAGTVLAIPPQLDAPADAPPLTPSATPDEVVLNIAGDRFRFWNKISINLAIDRAPTAEVFAVWEPENVELRRVFRPLSFHPTDISLGGERLFTGTLLTAPPETTPEGSTISAPAYGKTGVLSDCTASASSKSLEFNDQSLHDIARELLTPFGIGVKFDAPAGATFEQVAISTSDKILPFLADLAQQRNMVLGETSEGKAWFRQSSPGGQPVAVFREGQPPAHSISSVFGAQSVYSHVTGITPEFVGLKGDKVTVKNPHLSGVFRPYVFDADDSKGASIQDLVDAKVGRMYANMVSWRILVPTWRDAKGDRWTPDSTVMVTAPRAMIYKETELLVRAVVFHATAKQRYAELDLVLPGAFAGKVPETLPWDE